MEPPSVKSKLMMEEEKICSSGLYVTNCACDNLHTPTQQMLVNNIYINNTMLQLCMSQAGHSLCALCLQKLTLCSRSRAERDGEGAEGKGRGRREADHVTCFALHLHELRLHDLMSCSRSRAGGGV